MCSVSQSVVDSTMSVVDSSMCVCCVYSVVGHVCVACVFNG